MKVSLLSLCISFSLIVFASDPPVELGAVNWERDFEAGVEKAHASEKPIFLLFQEVPGCGTCQRYGQQVLSHPLIVEAIETLFIPVAIYNNKGGADKKVLQYYQEPSWNNPVVRIVGANKQDLIPRLSGKYSPQGVVQAMVQALITARRPVPSYLRLLDEELSSRTKGTETAYLSMYCFWSGEKELGKMDGVVATLPGFMHGHEVVKVDYDPNRIDLEDMVSQAANAQCADQVFVDSDQQVKAAEKVKPAKAIKNTGKFRLDREPKYYLSKSIYRHIPMTELQAARANSLIAQQRSPESVLSQRQIDLLKTIRQHPDKNWPNVIHVELGKAWDKINKV